MRAVLVSHAYLEPAHRGKLRALAGLGCSLTVAVPDSWVSRDQSPPRKAQWGNDAGARIVPIPISGQAPGRPGHWRSSALRRLLTDFRPEIIQVEEEPWTPVAATVTRLAGSLHVPVVLFGWVSLDPRLSPLASWRRRRTLGRVQGLLGVNRSAVGLLTRFHSRIPSAVMPQLGVTPPLDLARDRKEGLSIGYVGRLVPEKGLDLLFRACIKLAGPWRLTVVGSGPAQEEQEALAERLGIAARVKWLGAIPASELGKLWPSFDCLVVPSRSTPNWVESFHAPLVQAMGHGVTIIGADSGAIPELIDTAGLVVPEDNVPALTAALQHLSDSPRERERFGREGRLRVMSEYTDDAVARKTMEFWERVTHRATS